MENILLTAPRPFKLGDKITPQVINDTIATAVKAYNVVAGELLKAKEVDWNDLSFHIDSNDELIVEYKGRADLSFEIDAGGYLVLNMTL